jgi:hypothetical protein
MIGTPAQVPAVQTSPVVQGSPSSQGSPSVQPVPAHAGVIRKTSAARSAPRTPGIVTRGPFWRISSRQGFSTLGGMIFTAISFSARGLRARDLGADRLLRFGRRMSKCPLPAVSLAARARSRLQYCFCSGTPQECPWRGFPRLRPRNQQPERSLVEWMVQRPAGGLLEHLMPTCGFSPHSIYHMMNSNRKGALKEPLSSARARLRQRSRRPGSF